jgi:pimeloyl-ACP methyl ester carboxylesterase
MATLALLLLAILSQPVHAAPGRLVSASPLSPEVPRSSGWRITYESRDSGGQPIQVAGVVFTPQGKAPDGGWPVIAWAHGSWGIEPQCNIALKPALWAVSPFFKTLLERGYAVVATDYAGFGMGGVHPYLVGDASAYAVIDAVRAAVQVRGANTGRRYAVWGESQGGHAALWTGEKSPSYAPGLTLVAVAAAAPPTDLAANLGGKTDPTVRAFLTAYVAASWEQYYGADLRAFTGPIGADLIRRISKNCVDTNGFKFMTKIGLLRLRGALKGVDLPAIEPWRTLIARNSVPRTPPSAPLLVAQGGKDVIVAPDVTRDYAKALCRQGKTLQFLWLPAMEHPQSARDTAEATINWFSDRFAGRPEPDDCSRI